MLSLLLPNDDLREQVYDYIPLLLAEFQGGLEALFITQVRTRLKKLWSSRVHRYQQAQHLYPLRPMGNKLSFQVEGSQRVQEATENLL